MDPLGLSVINWLVKDAVMMQRKFLKEQTEITGSNAGDTKALFYIAEGPTQGAAHTNSLLNAATGDSVLKRKKKKDSG